MMTFGKEITSGMFSGAGMLLSSTIGAANAAAVRTGPPVGVGIGSLPMTPNKNGEIGVLCVEAVLAGTGQHNKT